MFTSQKQLSRVLNCEEVYIFVRDLNGQLKVVTRDKVVKHYTVEQAHLIGKAFQTQEITKIRRTKCIYKVYIFLAMKDYMIYTDLVLREVQNGHIVPILNKKSKECIGILVALNKLHSKGLNHDEVDI